MGGLVGGGQSLRTGHKKDGIPAEKDDSPVAHPLTPEPRTRYQPMLY